MNRGSLKIMFTVPLIKDKSLYNKQAFKKKIKVKFLGSLKVNILVQAQENTKGN